MLLVTVSPGQSGKVSGGPGPAEAEQEPRSLLSQALGRERGSYGDWCHSQRGKLRHRARTRNSEGLGLDLGVTDLWAL